MTSFPHYRLDPGRPYKALDFGNGLLAGSVAFDGRILALNTYHPVHGYVSLSAHAPFPDDRRRDQAAVRAYRAALAAHKAPTFGLRPLPGSAQVETFLLAGAIPHTHFRTGSVRASVTTWAPRIEGRPIAGALQIWRFRNLGDELVELDLTWEGTLALSRASYTQLTERGPLQPIDDALRLVFDGEALSVEAPGVGMAAVIEGLGASDPWRLSGQTLLPVAIPGRVTIAPHQTAYHTLFYALAETPEEARAAISQLRFETAQSLLTATIRDALLIREATDPKVPHRARDLVYKAQTYARDCCALPVGKGLCLLTDHQILPLSWTRDSYYMIEGLRSLGGPGAGASLLRHHLLWLFETAQRPAGYWGRAYLANGQPKDGVFQLDQQCYPLLELAEYADEVGDDAIVADLVRRLPEILDAILARQGPGVALFATEETPADDPLPLPYHFSSQVLLWHTLRRLAPLNDRWGFTTLDLERLSAMIRADVRRHLLVERDGRRIFSYATDLRGAHRFYHDANDFPTVLAPLWGFCAADDPIWRATMEFAFSPQNVEGYFPGQYGGLGSVHTPGPWPLGDVQELLYARIIGDAARFESVLDRLTETACWDGALPEARDERTGAVRSRHWFAWPGAVLVAALANPTWRP